MAATEERKNLSAASLDSRSPRLMPTSANAGRLATSRAMISVVRSREAGSSAAPEAEDSSRNQYSPAGSSSAAMVCMESRAVSSAPPMTSSWTMSVKWSAT